MKYEFFEREYNFYTWTWYNDRAERIWYWKLDDESPYIAWTVGNELRHYRQWHTPTYTNPATDGGYLLTFSDENHFIGGSGETWYRLH